jgi:hypothetical protein
MLSLLDNQYSLKERPTRLELALNAWKALVLTADTTVARRRYPSSYHNGIYDFDTISSYTHGFLCILAHLMACTSEDVTLVLLCSPGGTRTRHCKNFKFFISAYWNTGPKGQRIAPNQSIAGELVASSVSRLFQLVGCLTCTYFPV